MKTAFLIALAILVCAMPASAQNRIELYADAGMATCSISEPVSPPVVQVHVFIVGPTASRGARFTAPKPACWVGASWLGDALQPGFAAIGTSQDDWSVASGSCIPTPVYIGWISYLISGQALPCCVVDALPAIQFAFVDCNFAEHPLEPSKSIVVNPNESCGCQSGIGLAVEESSWGRVKSLYR